MRASCARGPAHRRADDSHDRDRRRRGDRRAGTGASGSLGRRLGSGTSVRPALHRRRNGAHRRAQCLRCRRERHTLSRPGGELLMTKPFTDLQAWREERRTQCRAGRSLGFVPTMGALHEGHLSLVQRSRSENDGTLVSIFVNPTQFDDRVDYEKYPRRVDDDMQMLRAAGADYVLLPTQADLYPDAFRYRVSEVDHSRTLEGAHRPGHFDAVLTVVLKLLQLARAERAYFGEKDWQQLQLVRGMADAFFLPTLIVPVGTVRELDGLALSSRNRRLAAADRA